LFVQEERVIEFRRKEKKLLFTPIFTIKMFEIGANKFQQVRGVL
jgi:hypothetical protein